MAATAQKARGMTSVTLSQRTRSRVLLLLIAAIFLAPFATALYLFYAGWQPQRTKNHGELLAPARDLREVRFTRADGSRFEWHHEDHVWRVLAVMPPQCAVSCERLADTLQRVWVGMGHDADSIQVLWVGPPPPHGFRGLIPVSADASLLSRLPDKATPDAIPVYVVDPSGYLFMRYKPGFDPTGLRKDLKQLLPQLG
jgi:hypothetical protein